VREAAEAMQRAAGAMRAASESARSEDAAAAASEARAAESALSEALDAMRESRAQAQSSGQGSPSGEMAEAQAQLGQETDAARSQAGQGSMSPSGQSETQRSLAEAREAMQRAAEQMKSGRSASAAGSQREALEALQRAREAAASDVQPKTPEQEARSSEQAAEQEAIRKALLDLATRNKERRDAPRMQSLERASSKASEAQKSLSEGELDEAVEQEQEVERELAQADRELADEEEQYQRLRQEEMLLRVAEEVRAMTESHAEAQASVRDVDAARAGNDRPSRAERLRLRRVAKDESALATRAGEIAQAIEEESSLVFAHLMRESERDLARVAELLDETGGWQTGDRVQTLQEDVEESLSWVLEALRKEQRRREEEEQQKKQQGEGPQPPDNGQNRLVPDVAELKLLRRMEVETLDRLNRLLLLNPELLESVDEADPALLDEVLRLAERHERTTRLFETFRVRLGLPAPEGSEKP